MTKNMAPKKKSVIVKFKLPLRKLAPKKSLIVKLQVPLSKASSREGGDRFGWEMAFFLSVPSSLQSCKEPRVCISTLVTHLEMFCFESFKKWLEMIV